MRALSSQLCSGAKNVVIMHGRCASALHWPASVPRRRRELRQCIVPVLANPAGFWGVAKRGNASQAATEKLPRRLFPPREGPTNPKAEAFAKLVGSSIEAGDTIEIRTIGARASWHALRALALSPIAAVFQVTSVGIDNSDTSERALRLLARRAPDHVNVVDHMGTLGSFVSNNTSLKGLAKKLVIDLRAGDAYLHTYADAERAMEAILKAIAMTPKLADVRHRPVDCIAVVVEQQKEGVSDQVPRIAVRVSRVEGDEECENVFTAFPPGAEPDFPTLRRFQQSVQDRLARGMMVKMECRGRHAISHAIEALARVQQRTASFEARWVDGFVADSGKLDAQNERASGVTPGGRNPSGRNPVARSILLRSRQGDTWADFNAIDFKRTNKIVATPTANVGGLARAIGSEVRKHGGVAVHADADDPSAIDRAVKALASVPVESEGLSVACVPSLGQLRPSAKPGKSASSMEGNGATWRLVRLYVRRLNTD